MATRLRCLLLPATALAALAMPAAAQVVKAPALAARLAAEKQALRPGESGTLAVILEVPAGWHLYAPSLNDTGLPLSLEPHLPAGWTLESITWPVPARLPEPGEMLDHVYTGRVVVPLHVKVPAEAAGSTARVEVHTEWMVCKTACVLGEADVALEIPVAAAGANVADSSDAALLRAVQPPPLLAAGAPLSATLVEGALLLHAPGAAGLQFLPDADCAAPRDLLHQGAASGETLRLQLQPQATGAVRGIAVLQWPAGRTTDFFRIELPLAAASIAPGAATRPPPSEESRHDP
jgi:DsbC/DsbD-like thiol-disulfide interchange protein